MRLAFPHAHGQADFEAKHGARGEAHLDKHSGVPRMSVGDVVGVRTGSGRLVSRGTFHLD